MGDERDDPRILRRLDHGAGAVTRCAEAPVRRLWPVIVATRRRSIARSAIPNVRRLTGVEPATPGRGSQFAMEGGAEAEKPSTVWLSDGVQPCRETPIVGGHHGRLLQVVRDGLRLGRVEELQQPGRERVAPFPKEDALLVRQGKHPRQFGVGVATDPAIRSGDPGGG